MSDPGWSQRGGFPGEHEDDWVPGTDLDDRLESLPIDDPAATGHGRRPGRDAEPSVPEPPTAEERLARLERLLDADLTHVRDALLAEVADIRPGDRGHDVDLAARIDALDARVAAMARAVDLLLTGSTRPAEVPALDAVLERLAAIEQRLDDLSSPPPSEPEPAWLGEVVARLDALGSADPERLARSIDALAASEPEWIVELLTRIESFRAAVDQAAGAAPDERIDVLDKRLRQLSARVLGVDRKVQGVGDAVGTNGRAVQQLVDHIDELVRALVGGA